MMKKIITFACAAVMTVASSVLAFADEPIGVITTPYTFEGEDRSGANYDAYENPFKNKGMDVATIQYTVTIPENPKYLTGYDTVMTFGSSNTGFIYVCNELVGINTGGFVDYWPSGTPGTMVYPGKGQTYTVNLVISADGVAFYLNGELQPGSNVAATNAEGVAGTLTGSDMINWLNKESALFIGDKNTSYWAAQNMTLMNVAFFTSEVTSPYTFTGNEPEVVREGQKQTTTAAKDDKKDNSLENSSAGSVTIVENEGTNTTLIMVIVIVVIVIVIGVAVVVIISGNKRRR